MCACSVYVYVVTCVSVYVVTYARSRMWQLRDLCACMYIGKYMYMWRARAYVRVCLWGLNAYRDARRCMYMYCCMNEPATTT